MAGDDVHRNLQRSAAALDAQDVAVLDAEQLGLRRGDQRGVVPGELGDGVGPLLEPGVVGEAAIVDAVVGCEDEFLGAAGAVFADTADGERRGDGGPGGVADDAVL